MHNYQETEEAQQTRLRLQKNMGIVTWICISAAAIALIVALILSYTEKKPLDPPIETWLLPMWIAGAICFFTGIFWERVYKYMEFGASKQGPVMFQFQQCSNFLSISILGIAATIIGAPLYYSLIFFAFAALGFYLAFPTNEKVAILLERLEGKGQNRQV
jgi:hypothetical protein